MATCWKCGSEFDIAATREEFNDAVNGEFNYDKIADGECSNCAIPENPGEIASNIALGRAIEMSLGERDYDPDEAL